MKAEINMNISTFIYSALFLVFIAMVLSENRFFVLEHSQIQHISLDALEEQDEATSALSYRSHADSVELLTRQVLLSLQKNDDQSFMQALSAESQQVQGDVLKTVSTQLIEQKQFDKNIFMLSGITQSQRIALRLQFDYARSLAKLNDVEKAKEAYAELIKAIPSHQAGAINLGILLNRQGHFDKTIKTLTPSLSLSAGKKKSKILSLLGSSYKALGNWKLAEKRYLESINYRPGHGLTWLNLAKVQKFQQRPYEKVKLTYERAVSLLPDTSLAWFELGEITLRAGEFNDSVNALKKAAKLSPQHSKTRLLLAWALFESGQHDASLNQWKWLDMHGARKSYRLTARHMQSILNGEENHFVPLAKSYPQKPYLVALELAQKQQWKASLEALKKITPDSPFYLRALFRQRAMYNNLGQKSEIIRIDAMLKNTPLHYDNNAMSVPFKLSKQQGDRDKIAVTEYANTESTLKEFV